MAMATGIVVTTPTLNATTMSVAEEESPNAAIASSVAPVTARLQACTLGSRHVSIEPKRIASPSTCSPLEPRSSPVVVVEAGRACASELGAAIDAEATRQRSGGRVAGGDGEGSASNHPSDKRSVHRDTIHRIAG